jgi:hypothetical protein
MKQTSKRFSSLILALLFFVAALMVFFDLVQPAYGDLETAKGQLQSNQAFLLGETKTVDQVDRLIKNSSNNTQDAQTVNAALPIGTNLSSALAQIYGLAAADTMNITSVGIATQAGISTGALGNATSVASIAGGAQIVKPYGTISFTITAAGTYENLVSYLSHLETNVRLLDVRSVAFQSAAPQATKTGTATGVSVPSDYFGYTINVVAYYESVN